jgi:chromate transporter
MSSERFLDLMGVTNLIHGPSSSELAVFIGFEQAGLAGLVVAGVCFVLPAALMSAAIAWAYLRYGALPQVGGLLYGIKPVVVAIVMQALWGLAPKAIKKSAWLGALGVAACVATALHVDALVVLSASGVVALSRRAIERRTGDGPRHVAFVGPLLATAGAATPAGVSLTALGWTFLKLGSVVFGSGYVLVAFLRADLVDRLHWLSESQLLDAVAVGQVTPGPVFTTATFLGYLLAGPKGAVVATIAVFLPGFVLVAAIRPFVARARASWAAGAFLDGVNVGSLALMAVVTVQLAESAVVDAVTILLAALSALLLIRFKVSSTWVLAGGAVVGALSRAIG